MRSEKEWGRRGSVTAGFRPLALGCDGNDDGDSSRPVKRATCQCWWVREGEGEGEGFGAHEAIGSTSICSVGDGSLYEFVHEQDGILKIPCELDYFKRVVEQLSKNK